MTIGANIKEARKAANMTQKELGKKLGMTQSAIAMFENDKTNIKFSTLEKIANALQVPALYLLDENILQHVNTLEKQSNRFQLLILLAERLFSLLWFGEADNVNIRHFDIDKEISVLKDGVEMFTFKSVDFLNLIEDAFLYFEFKLHQMNNDD
ncbi:XRE family transcriptional regulator [Clostridiales bacterium]|nr:XRE family transcriptional regulator [Clostridiales bacterium]